MEPTLGNSARVVVDKSLVESYKPNLPSVKKRELRREQIIAYIKRKPLVLELRWKSFSQ